MINPSYLSVDPSLLYFDQAVLFMEDEVKGEKLGLCKTCVGGGEKCKCKPGVLICTKCSHKLIKRKI